MSLSDTASAIAWANDKLFESVGKELAAAFEATGIDLDALVTMDMSPEAVSDRIVKFSTGLFGKYREQEPELTGAALAEGFEDTIRGSIDKGFGEALQIIEALKLGETIVNTSHETHELVGQKLDAFFETFQAKSS